MSDSVGFVLAVVVSELVPGIIYLYASYWALAIRRALVGRIYRSHALWLGTLGVILAATGVLTYSTDPAIQVLFSVFYAVVFVALFAFIDSTVKVARRSDPLFRSIIRWDKLRLLLWADVVVLGGFNFLPVFDPAFYYSPSGQFFGNFGWTALGAGLFGPSAVALIIGRRRSRDSVLHESLKWMGTFLILGVAAFIIIAIETGGFGVSQFDTYYSYAALPQGFVFLFMGYALYKSAKSLAPMNRIQPLEPLPTPSP